MTGFVTTPRPRDVEGFAAARAAGSTPARPGAPPALEVSPTAHAALTQLGVGIAASVLASLLVVVLGPSDDGQLEPPTALATVVVLIVGFLVCRALLRRFRDAFVAELQAGYVTTTFLQGMFWVRGDSSPRPAGGEDVVGWSWDALWVLGPDGSVRAAPEAEGDPPGLYPSPNAPGERELWTGHRWTGVFPDR